MLNRMAGLPFNRRGGPPSLSAPLSKVCALQSLATRQGKAGNDPTATSISSNTARTLPGIGPR